MKNKLVLGLFGCLAAIQIATPIFMITTRESTLKNGVLFKFETAAVDSFDAFRGKYVALRIKENEALVPHGMNLTNGQNVYVTIALDDLGFARPGRVALHKPEDIPFLTARVRYCKADKAFLDLPMDRYYMNETAAPEAERIYRQSTQATGKQNAYITVRIKNGLAVIDKLYVDGKPIEELLKKAQSVK